MREILFRGKRVDNGEWIEGYYATDDDGSANIISTIGLWNGLWFYVIPETVGQFTGLTDKSGQRIFEGDIVEPVYITPFGSKTDVYDSEDKRIIEYRYGEFAMAKADRNPTRIKHYIPHHVTRYAENYGNICEPESNTVDCCIIGNIHDNPELLKGGE